MIPASFLGTSAGISARPLGAYDLNMNTVSVLIVEDDPATRHTIANYLEEHCIRSIPAFGRKEMIRYLAVDEPSLAILNLGVGQENGLDLLRELRSRSDVPVVLTASPQCDEMHRVIGLDLGADDCVTKPLRLRELLARIRAVLRGRKAGRTAPRPQNRKRDRCRFGSWQFEGATRRLTDPHGDVVVLTRREHALLTAFLAAPQRPLSREYLLQATRMHEDISDRSIDIQVLRLRRKLEVDAAAPRVIQTERGVGYVFALPVERL